MAYRTVLFAIVSTALLALNSEAVARESSSVSDSSNIDIYVARPHMRCGHYIALLTYEPMALEGIPLRGGFLVRNPFHTVHTTASQKSAEGAGEGLTEEAPSGIIESSIRDIITLRSFVRNDLADFVDSVRESSASESSASMHAAVEPQELTYAPYKLSEEFPSGFALAGHSNAQNIAPLRHSHDRKRWLNVAMATVVLCLPVAMIFALMAFFFSGSAEESTGTVMVVTVPDTQAPLLKTYDESYTTRETNGEEDNVVPYVPPVVKY